MAALGWLAVGLAAITAMALVGVWTGRQLQRRQAEYPPVRAARLVGRGPWDGEAVAATPWGRDVLAAAMRRVA